MKIVIPAFNGQIPRLSARLLPPGTAQLAQNCKLYSRELDSFRQPRLVYTSAKMDVQSAYRMYSGATDYWLTWNEDVDAVKGPIAGDTSFRLFYTGDSAGQGWPKKTTLALATGAADYPYDYLEMGIPKPTVAPTISTAGGTGTNVTGGYFYTLYASTWDEEGPPSNVVEATFKVDGTWTVTMGTAVPGPSAKYVVDQKRLYRTIVSASGLVDYYRVATVGLSTATYADVRSTNTDAVIAKNPICPSIEIQGAGLVVSGSEWNPPPTDMKGLCAGANGMAAGFSKNTVCFAEPYRWHAWPSRYQYALPWDVVWIGFSGNVLYVATKGRPYLFVGNHPSAMNQVQIERDDMPCLSKRSGVTSSMGGLFAAPHGLAAIGVGMARYVTQGLMLKDEWEALCFPDTIVARAYNDRYVGFFDSGSGKNGFILDPNDPGNSLVYVSRAANGVYTDPETAKLYLLINDGVWEWEGDSNNYENRDYRTGQFVTPRPVNFGAYQVDADFDELGGDFAAEQATIAAETAFNQSLLSTLTENWSNGTAGKIKGDLGSHCLGGYMPDQDGPAGSNNHGIMLGGHLLIGGIYSTYANRFLTFELYGLDYEDNAMTLLWADTLTSGKPQRMGWEGKHDVFEVRIQGNVRVRPPLRIAETMRELRDA